MGVKQVEAGQEVFILLVSGAGGLPHRAVGKATVEDTLLDGTVLVSTPKGHNCPWKRAPDEVFPLKAEAEAALRAWQESLPSLEEVFGVSSLGEKRTDPRG